MRTSIGTAAAVTLALGLVATACTSGGGAVPPAGKPVALGGVKLVAYTGCDDMLAGLRKATADNIGPYGIGGGGMPVYAAGQEADAAAKAGPAGSGQAHSTTNVHEAGVDEPDPVKTDGQRIISYARGVLRVVDVASKKVTGTLPLVPRDQRWAPADLLVHGDRALVLFSGGGVLPLGAVAKRPASPGPRYLLVDLKELKVLGSITPEGAHVDARMVGSTVRVVVRSQPEITFPPPRPSGTESELIARNRDIVRAAPIDAWLPTYEVAGPDGTTRTEKVPCDRVSHPVKYTGSSMLTMHTIDLAAGIDGDDPISVAADGDTVYATQRSLYVTSNPRWWFPRDFFVDTPPIAPRKPAVSPGAASSATAPPSAVAPQDQPSTPPAEKVEPDPPMPSLRPEPTATPTGTTASPSPVPPVKTPTGTPSADREPPEQTEVHRFDITGTGAPRYVASGVVPGRLLNQYSLSDHEGNLRVATTSSGDAAARSSSGVYVLKADTLAKVGQVTGLGRGERIYSVRFIGPVGYVVTFKQVDPLYTLDLRDPAQPEVTGELKITGYSAYLHPAGEGRLLGIGQEASAKGRTLGTQVSLFDVRDPATPARLSRFHQKDSGSEAEWDPHAFLYWPASGLAVLPINTWGRPGPSDRTGPEPAALVLKVSDASITKTGLITHPKAPRSKDPAPGDPRIRRVLVIGDTLWTFSDLGLKASDATTLAAQGWILFAP